MLYDKVDVRLVGDSMVEVRRSFRAPRALVWRAHTEPALFRRWMLGPPGWTMAACEMDVRVGGAYRCLWRNNDDGTESGVYGDYREVAAPARLVTTEFYATGEAGADTGPGSLQTIELTESGGVTTLLQRNDFYTREARDAAIAGGMCDGVEQSYAMLEAVLKAA